MWFPGKDLLWGQVSVFCQGILSHHALLGGAVNTKSVAHSRPETFLPRHKVFFDAVRRKWSHVWLTQVQDRRTRFALILTFHHRPPPPGGTSSRHRALQASCLQTSPWRCSVHMSCSPGQTRCIYVCTQFSHTDAQSLNINTVFSQYHQCVHLFKSWMKYFQNK